MSDDRLPVTFEAKYAGPCRVCGDWFDSGERISKLVDGSYVHPGCAEAVQP